MRMKVKKSGGSLKFGFRCCDCQIWTVHTFTPPKLLAFIVKKLPEDDSAEFTLTGAFKCETCVVKEIGEAGIEPVDMTALENVVAKVDETAEADREAFDTWLDREAESLDRPIGDLKQES